MYCDGCGTMVQPGQEFCGKCGKQIVGPVPVLQLPPTRVQTHVRLLGLLWLAYSAFNTVVGVVLYVIANTLFAHGRLGAPDSQTFFLRPLLSVIAILVLAKAALGFIAGWGLLQRDKWARVLVLVLAFISLFTNIPIGTALGIYTMWVLLSSDSEREYEALVAAQPA
jgi:hypothetical protein